VSATNASTSSVLSLLTDARIICQVSLGWPSLWGFLPPKGRWMAACGAWMHIYWCYLQLEGRSSFSGDILVNLSPPPLAPNLLANYLKSLSWHHH
jgi:hypothetical protein